MKMNQTLNIYFKPIDKCSLYELSPHFGVSKSTAPHRLKSGSKNYKAVKPGKSFWCTIKKHKEFRKLTPTIKAAVN